MRKAYPRESLNLGLADWRYLAREDTGCMFEIAACLGARSQGYRRFGRLLGMLYHGCDDVSDVRGSGGLHGGGDEDVRDRILTLPAALAIEADQRIREIFESRNPRKGDGRKLLAAYHGQLDNADRVLDRIRDEALREIDRLNPASPAILRELVRQVRELSD